jgi:uncharacterized protein (TIGR02996 family)
MADERQFLNAIESQPEDGTVRLAYADWLQERGDPRSEVVRVHEESKRSANHMVEVIAGAMTWKPAMMKGVR